MRRGLVISAGAVAAALALAACGGGGGNALESVAKAASKTAGTSSAKFHMDVAETIGPLGPLHFTADGVSDNASRSADMTMDLSSVAALAGGSADQWKGHVIVDGSGKTPVLYLRLPALDKYLSGKKWAKADLGALAQKNGVDLGQLLQTAGAEDPTKALQLLQSVGDVSKVGTETIDGTETTEYSGTVDVKKVASVLGASESKALEKAGVNSIPIDVWIGGDGLVRRIHESFSSSAGGAKATTDLTIGLSDFGTKVSVTPPPADQTADLSTLGGVGA
jgi:LppX_LprAFG lipoprotein